MGPAMYTRNICSRAMMLQMFLREECGPGTAYLEQRYKPLPLALEPRDLCTHRRESVDTIGLGGTLSLGSQVERSSIQQY